MFTKILDQLIEMAEKILNTPYTINSCQEFLSLSIKVKTFMDDTLKNFPATRYILRDIFIRNGIEIDVGWCDSKSCIPYTQKMIEILKRAKECLVIEIKDSKKDSIFHIEQNISQGNLAQNLGGTIQGDFNFNNNREKPPTLLERILKLPSFIYKLFLNFIK